MGLLKYSFNATQIFATKPTVAIAMKDASSNWNPVSIKMPLQHIYKDFPKFPGSEKTNCPASDSDREPLHWTG